MSGYFYIQRKGFAGDCLLWWRANRCGYTTDLDQALLVLGKEADDICADRPDQDKRWPKEVIDRIAERHVNSEHMEAR